MSDNDEQAQREDDRMVERNRADAADTDAPTAAEENEGMSTILSSDPIDGVQGNESEQ